MWYQGYGGMGVPALDFDKAGSPWTGFDARNLLYTIGYASSWFYYSTCAQEHGITGRSGPMCLAKLSCAAGRFA